MNLIRSALVLMILAFGSAPLSVVGAEMDDVLVGIGYLDDLADDRSSLIIEGIRYLPAPDIVVQVGGSVGALSMLQSGMKVLYRYRRSTDGPRELMEVRQIPPATSIEEHRS